MTEAAIPFRDTNFTVAPHAAVAVAGHRLLWPDGGLPVALDIAASTLLDCYRVPTSPEALATDLEEVVGLDAEAAMSAAIAATTDFQRSGLVVAEGQVPMPARELAYPAGASP